MSEPAAALLSGGRAGNESDGDIRGAADSTRKDVHVALQQAAHTSSTSSVERLYSHALQSIFAFATVPDLAALMAVNRSWQAAVMHMRPISGSFGPRTHKILVSLQAMYTSPLRRHISSIALVSCRVQFSTFLLDELSVRLPHVRSLHVCLFCPPAVAGAAPPLLRFPAQLQSLTLRCMSETITSPELPLVVADAIAVLPELRALELWCRTSSSLDVLFTRLSEQQGSQLRRLLLRGVVKLSANKIAGLREMRHLHELQLPPALRWSELLQPGHQMLQLRIIHVDPASQTVCSALVSLPTLTDVTLAVEDDVTDASFLSALPQLQRLRVQSCTYRPPTAAFLSDALPRCPRLTHLTLYNASLPSSVTDCFQHMVHLCSLTLNSCNMVSLLFLTSMPSADNLTHLDLHDCKPWLSATELQHLWRLRALQSLRLTASVRPDIIANALVDFQPPCRLLPALLECVIAT